MNIIKEETVGGQTVVLNRRHDNRLSVLSFGTLGFTCQPFKPWQLNDAKQYFGAKVTNLTTFTFGGQHYE